MDSFQKDTIAKVGGGLPFLRGEYISSQKGFDVKKYQYALENYTDTIKNMAILPLDDFYRIGVEHLHELDEIHKKMLVDLKRNADELEQAMVPAKIKEIKSVLRIGLLELQDLGKEFPDFIESQSETTSKKG